MSQSYQVLARKYRPNNFHELIGQTHVSQALINAIDHNRLHHAYLFTGTRGVGKTTIARILAKCLNCDTGVTSTPCGTCDTCVSIEQGRFIDLIEIDAASRTKVEDTRELLDNVPYAPTQGRYKVYLIDEVHMLSTHSFNALLKTLEEPPEHVKFLLATTDPQKLPITIISRCLQFVLRPLPQKLLSEHLSALLDKEGVEYEDSALWQLAHAAKGSVRDSLSLTDQAIAFGQGKLSHATVKDMLGLLDSADLSKLITHIHSGDKQAVAYHIEQMRQQLVDAGSVFDEMADLIHKVAMVQLIPSINLNVNDTHAHEINTLASTIEADVLQLYYEIIIKSRENIMLATTPMQSLEMCLLRLLAFRPLSNEEIPTATIDANAYHTTEAKHSGTAIEQMAKPITSLDNIADTSIEEMPDTHSSDLGVITPVILASQVSEEQSSELSELTETKTVADAVDISSVDHNKMSHEVKEAVYLNNIDKMTQSAVIEENNNSIDDIKTVDNPNIIIDENEIEENDLEESEIEEDFLLEILDAPTESSNLSDNNTQTAQKTNGKDNVGNDFNNDTHIMPNPMSTATSMSMPETFSELLVAEAEAKNSDNSSQNNISENINPEVTLDNSVVSQKSTVSNIVESDTGLLDKPVIPEPKSDGIDNKMDIDGSIDDPRDLLKCQKQALVGQWTAQKWDYWLQTARETMLLDEDELALARQGVMTGDCDGVSVFKSNMQDSNFDVVFTGLTNKLKLQFTNASYQLTALTADDADYLLLKDEVPVNKQQQRQLLAENVATQKLSSSHAMQALVNDGGVIRSVKLL